MKNVEQFKKDCNKICYNLLSFECFNEDDDYDLIELLKHYIDIKSDITPYEFVMSTFDEDINYLEYQEHLREEAEEYYWDEREIYE